MHIKDSSTHTYLAIQMKLLLFCSETFGTNRNRRDDYSEIQQKLNIDSYLHLLMMHEEHAILTDPKIDL